MAIIEELKVHINKASPEGRGLLTKAAAKMSPKQQQDFLASLQLGDAEFQTAVGDYMPEGSTIDPSVARLKAFPEEAAVGPRGTTLKGLVRRANTPPATESFRGYTVDIEPNTVNAIEAVNAKPWLWAHEYRHFEDTDADIEGWGRRTGTGLGIRTREVSNQIQDILSAQNPDEVRVRSTELLEHLFYNTELGGGQKKLVQDLHKKLFPSNSSDEELPELVQEVMAVSSLKKISDLVLDKDKVRHSPYFEKNIGYLTSEREGLQKPTMPEDYRKGGRVRLI
tara:strand:- start:2744 stop:3586 length:843 start_codon:yes stop_codon:yes gene_type:complete